MRIGIDAMGGDHAPDEEVKGALEACATLAEGDKIVLIGRQDEIRARLNGSADWSRHIEIAHAVEGNRGTLLLAVDAAQAERYMEALRAIDFGVVRER